MSDDLRAIVHDVRGSLGSIRLAITGLLGSDEDAEFRREMLQLADLEIQHASANLAGLHALLGTTGDRHAMPVIDVVNEAVRLASSAGVEVTVGDMDASAHAAAGPSTAVALAAMLQICGGGGAPVTVEVVGSDGRAALQLTGDGLRPPSRRLVEALAQSAFASDALVEGSTVSVELLGGG